MTQELLPVTREMAAAYVDWEPPFKEVPSKVPAVLGALRAAFFAGWVAALRQRPAVGEDVVERVAAAIWTDGHPEMPWSDMAEDRFRPIRQTYHSRAKAAIAEHLAALRERPAVGVVAERGKPMSLAALEAAREAWRVGHQKPDMFAGFLTDLHDRGFTIRAALAPTPQEAGDAGCQCEAFPGQLQRLYDALSEEILEQRGDSLWCGLCRQDAGADGLDHPPECPLHQPHIEALGDRTP